jgi:hypothetical protein
MKNQFACEFLSAMESCARACWHILLDDEPGCLCMENGQVASLPSNMTMVFNMRFLLCV